LREWKFARTSTDGRQVAGKAIVVRFMREEIWEEAADGSRQPRRDREEMMRKARIE